MKSKPSNSLRLILFTAIIIICCCLSCSRGELLKNEDRFDRYDIIVIDSCEYIQWGMSYGYLSVTHKGNCRYCAKRNKAYLAQ